MGTVVKQVPDARLCIIGKCEDNYRRFLDELITSLSITRNVVFAGYFELIEDVYNTVAKAGIAVLPGITAGLNSTIREAMLMGLPTICYRSRATDSINSKAENLIAAEKEDIGELAGLMIKALSDRVWVSQVAIRGKVYADTAFSNKAIVEKLLDNCKLIVDSYHSNDA